MPRKKSLLPLILGSLAIILASVAVISAKIPDQAPPNIPAIEENKDSEINTEEGSQDESTAPKEYMISFTDSGFSPSEITIKKGDTISFINNSEMQMWVASAPHPQHTDYPEFDTKKGYAPGEMYSFKFEKAGTWRYHDHLNPERTGTINVQ
ncbi:MAG TPA: cupredoxin domain-containing protein [bacterium]|nr:cupredoxin domain-containing protein [bacterium]